MRLESCLPEQLRHGIFHIEKDIKLDWLSVSSGAALLSGCQEGSENESTAQISTAITAPRSAPHTAPHTVFTMCRPGRRNTMSSARPARNTSTCSPTYSTSDAMMRIMLYSIAVASWPEREHTTSARKPESTAEAASANSEPANPTRLRTTPAFAPITSDITITAHSSTSSRIPMNNSLPRPRTAARHADFRPSYPFRETVRISDTPSRYAELSSARASERASAPASACANSAPSAME